MQPPGCNTVKLLNWLFLGDGQSCMWAGGAPPALPSNSGVRKVFIVLRLWNSKQRSFIFQLFIFIYNLICSLHLPENFIAHILKVFIKQPPAGCINNTKRQADIILLVCQRKLLHIQHLIRVCVLSRTVALVLDRLFTEAGSSFLTESIRKYTHHPLYYIYMFSCMLKEIPYIYTWSR